MNRMVKRLALFGLVVVGQHAHGALVPAKQTNPLELAGALAGVGVMAGVVCWQTEEIKAGLNHLLNPAPVSRNYEGAGIFVPLKETGKDTPNQVKAMHRDPLYQDAWRTVKQVGLMGGSLAVGIGTLNVIRKDPITTNMAPVFNTFSAASIAYGFLRYLPRLFTNYVTNMETMSFSHFTASIFVFRLLMGGLEKRGFQSLSFAVPLNK